MRKIFLVFLILVFVAACAPQETNTPRASPQQETLVAQPVPLPAPPPKLELLPPKPQPIGLDTKTFTWKFKQKTHTVTLPLFANYNQYFQEQPRVVTYRGKIPENWQEQIYVNVLSLNDSDGFTELVDYLNKTRREEKMSNDDFADFVITFVQTIPYDYESLADPNRQVRYPYQTLFDQTGVCSDKTLLAAKLLARFGYGVALFLFDNENHMSLGLQCPKETSSYLSGYCYVETTAAEAAGVAPEILGANITLASQPLVIAISNGTVYTRAADNLRKEIKRREYCAQLPQATEELQLKETRMKELESTASTTRNPQDYAEYRDAYTDYRREYEEYKVVHSGCQGIAYTPSGFY